MSEFQLRREIAALSTHILNMQRAIRKNKSSGPSLDALDSDDGRLRQLLDVRRFKEGLLSEAMRGGLKTAISERVDL